MSTWNVEGRFHVTVYHCDEPEQAIEEALRRLLDSLAGGPGIETPDGATLNATEVPE